MSGGVINSSILLVLAIVAGVVSLAIESFAWRGQGGISGIISGLKSIFGGVFKTFTVWDRSKPDFKIVSFTRLAVTFTLMIGLIVVILTTYDSVESFWVFFVLYLGVVLLLVPVAGHFLYMLYIMISSRSQSKVDDEE